MSDGNIDKYKFFRDEKFVSVMVFMGFIWLSLLVFFYLKTDEITKDPCSICAEKMGTKVICTTDSLIPLTRNYHPNGSITSNSDEIRNIINQEIDKQNSKEINFSGFKTK